ncbi:MAG TPA: hypothetical protein VGI26_11665 [Solirubrobacteraceae bacterium]|jgi:uncharacterized low-complexity protein
MKSSNTHRRGISALLVAALLLVAAFAATSSASAATIYACQKKKSGTIHLVTKKAKCKKGETKISWNTIGPAGKNGTNGANGANGKDGAPGQPQKAVTFNTTLESAFEPVPSAQIFSLGGVTVKMVCFFFIANFNTLEATGPSGSHAETGLVATNSAGKSPEIEQELVKNVALSSSFTKIAQLSTNVKEPFANIGHLNGSVVTSNSVVLFDAFMEAGPNPAGCTVRGTAFTIPV